MKLESITTIHARIGWQNLRTSEFLDSGEYMLITGTDFKNGEIDYSNIHYVEQERYEQDKKIQIEDGSILITKDGTLGKVAYVKELPAPATLNAGVFNVKVNKNVEVNQKYLFHYLYAPFLLKFASEQSTGGTIKHLNQNVLVKFQVPLTSFEEQSKISDFLTKFDQAITLQQRKLELLKKLKQGYLQQMFPTKDKVIPQLRFSIFNGDWEQSTLGDELDLLKDGTHGTHQDVDEGIYLLSAKNIKNGKINIDKLTDRKISSDEYNSIHKNFSLKKGDVLLTIVGSIGETAIIENPAGITFQRSVAYLRPNNKLVSEFLFTIMNGQQFQSELKKRQVVSAQPGIYLNDLSVISISIPIDEEQQKIGEFFQKLDQAITIQQSKLDKLKNIKQAYLQKLFP
ncbi:restriction endonuclease subunit S [Latilactobacillus sakei]|uniref:restriction endonuclease subunit S n=1 Tax=Latilactobacillus sakei TaxID=1599 RepID=UPI00388854AB